MSVRNPGWRRAGQRRRRIIMNLKQIKRLGEDGTIETINDICDGLKDFVANNPESAKPLLEELFTNVLEPLGSEDFFGTEGWEHCVGLED